MTTKYCTVLLIGAQYLVYVYRFDQFPTTFDTFPDAKLPFRQLSKKELQISFKMLLLCQLQLLFCMMPILLSPSTQIQINLIKVNFLKFLQVTMTTYLTLQAISDHKEQIEKILEVRFNKMLFVKEFITFLA
jgi:hypothetical protein